MRQALVFAVCVFVAPPALAQTRTPPTGQVTDDQDDADEQQQQQLRRIESQPTRAGRVAESSVGIVGQRQTREQAGKSVAPMGRIASRVQNRVQSRIRNRIDRDYDPEANATSPFAIAEEQTRTAGRPRR